MNTVIFKTDDAIFQFDQKEVEAHLKFVAAEHDIDDVTQLLKLISSSNEENIFTLKEHHYFGFVALELLSKGKGSVTCKLCKQTYPSNALKPFPVGHGKSPLKVNFKKEGRLRSLFIVGSINKSFKMDMKPDIYFIKPRSARLDAPSVIHHVMIRGIERRKIFRNNKDRNDMMDRLADLPPTTNTICYAWAFFSNMPIFCSDRGVEGSLA